MHPSKLSNPLDTIYFCVILGQPEMLQCTFRHIFTHEYANLGFHSVPIRQPLVMLPVWQKKTCHLKPKPNEAHNVRLIEYNPDIMVLCVIRT